MVGRLTRHPHHVGTSIKLVLILITTMVTVIVMDITSFSRANRKRPLTQNLVKAWTVTTLQLRIAFLHEPLLAKVSDNPN
jgi:hypothetical protein